jgi:hypothetical protein
MQVSDKKANTRGWDRSLRRLVADVTGYSYNYVFRVTSGTRRNHRIARAYSQLEKVAENLRDLMNNEEGGEA